MASLNAAELAFLESRQAEAVTLKAAIDRAERQISPLEDQINDFQPKIEELVAAQRAIAAKRDEVFEAHELGRLRTEYGDVTGDVTKLLRKQRGA